MFGEKLGRRRFRLPHFDTLPAPFDGVSGVHDETRRLLEHWLDHCQHAVVTFLGLIGDIRHNQNCHDEFPFVTCVREQYLICYLL